MSDIKVEKNKIEKNKNKKNKNKSGKTKTWVKALICVGVIALAAAAVLVFGLNIGKQPQDDTQISSANPPEKEDEPKEGGKVWDTNAGKLIIAVIGADEITEAEFLYYFSTQILIFEQVTSAAGAPDVWTLDFNGEKAEDFAKRQTLERIRLYKECVKRAKALEFSLTSQKLDEIDAFSKVQESSLPEELSKGMGVTLEIIKTFYTDIAYNQLLFAYYTEDFTPDSPEYDKAELARLIQEEIDYWENNAIETGQMEPDESFTPEEIQQIVDRVTNSYEGQFKTEYFEKLCSEWVEGIEIDINHDIYDKITVAGIPR